jgi:hypothetical protein
MKPKTDKNPPKKIDPRRIRYELARRFTRTSSR